MNLVIYLVYVHVGESAFLLIFFFISPSKNEKKKIQLLGNVLAKRSQKWTNYFKLCYVQNNKIIM